MSGQIRASCDASTLVAEFCKTKFTAAALLWAAALLLAGWRDLPAPVVRVPNPADPGAPVPRVEYRSTIGPYKSRRPVEPGPWREQNQRVAPQPKSSQ